MKHFKELGEIGYENLIAGEPFTLTTKKVSVSDDLKRGTLVTVSDGAATVATTTAGKNYAIIADDCESGEYVDAYVTGRFARDTVAKITDIEITEDVEEACRMDGIFFEEILY